MASYPEDEDVVVWSDKPEDVYLDQLIRDQEWEQMEGNFADEMSSSDGGRPLPKRRDEEKRPGSLYTNGTIGLSFEEPDVAPAFHDAAINKVKRLKRMLVCCVGVSLLLLLAVIVAASLALVSLRDNNDTSGQNAFEPPPPSTEINLSPWSRPIYSRKTDSPSTTQSTPTPTIAPITAPTTVIVEPTTDEFDEMRQRILLVSPSSQTALSLPSSPQYQALQWLSLEFNSISTNPDSRLVQRWVMATMFYSLGGRQWTRSENWLGEEHECSWFSANPDNYCDEEGNVVGIDLTDNALDGTIPDEVSLLFNTVARIFLNDNLNLRGTIPSQFGRLSRLKRFKLTGCSISGTLPTELGIMTSLESLGVGRNRFVGPIPTELGAIYGLKSLGLEGNLLTGTLPTQLGQLSLLELLALEDNRLMGPFPSQLANLMKLKLLRMNSNQITGTIPSQVCQNVQDDVLRVLEVDCAVSCNCCERCF